MSVRRLFHSGDTHGEYAPYNAKVVSKGALNAPDGCLFFQKTPSPAQPLPSPLVINSRLKSGTLSKRRFGPTLPHSGYTFSIPRSLSIKSVGQHSYGTMSESVTIYGVLCSRNRPLSQNDQGPKFVWYFTLTPLGKNLYHSRSGR
jgi:hypothetical protein